MARPLRSNFAVGSSFWAVRRAQWRALGISDADMEKPKIAVVNTSSELAICFSHLDGIAAAVKDAIRAAGGLPFEVRTTAPSDFIHSPGRRGTYILPARDLIVNDIEMQVEGAQLDGMVCLTSCDKTVPGHLMAAARLNLPTIMVICGYQGSGEHKGHHNDIEEVFLAAGHHAAGVLSLEDLKGMTDTAITSPGVCSGMGTANSMHIVTEALGMSLPGSAPVLANSPAMFAQVAAAGKRIVEMVEEDLRPRQIMSPGAFENAARAILSHSGSINCVKHLQATAVEAMLDLDVYAIFDRASHNTPVISAVRPMGDTSIEELEAAGGALAGLKQIEHLLDLDAMTVSGKSVRENLRGVVVKDEKSIRRADNAISNTPPIVIVRGSLAPAGAIIKMGVMKDKRRLFDGPAKVFEAPDDAIAAIRAGDIQSGDAIVLRGLGVRGGPGMGMASRVVFALDGTGFGADVAVITDGQLSGLVNKGLVVGEVDPEAATGGPIGLVKNGDRITVDVDAQVVDLHVPEAELAERRRAFRTKPATNGHSWLSVYEKSVQPLSRGAALVSDNKS